jgi:hypothetical protein
LFDDATKQFVAFVGRGDTGSSQERFGSDLRLGVRVGDEVVVPVWMPWCAAVRGEDGNGYVVDTPVGERGDPFAA